MIPRVPFVVRVALTMLLLVLGFVLSVTAIALEAVAHWITPEIGRPPQETDR